mmetsp:Transcript_12446/g.25347  ORF Transcript_12446/g.25347 Transcript_12446/m.25347 type:complete len:397 (-) Transcript_12446:171-1361(-)
MTGKPLILAFAVWYVAYLVRAEDDVAPAPPSIGADVPLTYFGPAPSQVQKELIGPFQLLKSGVVDQASGTITLPLYEGYYQDGKKHYFILTDTTDQGNGAALGLNFSPKLNYAAQCGKACSVVLKGLKIFNRVGKVNFFPSRRVRPGKEPRPFPPSSFRPGSQGDKFYTPVIRIRNLDNSVYNAPIVADGTVDSDMYCDGIPVSKSAEAYRLVHDAVVAICPRNATVTLRLVPGFSFARPILYLSIEASSAMVAALEGNTFAPALANNMVGADDSAFSPVERLFATINGPSNSELPNDFVGNHPSRQGFYSALRGEGAALNVLGGIPTVATDYSPLWDVNVGEWTQTAVRLGLRVRLLEEFQILGLVERGLIKGPGGVDYGSSGTIVNCPIAFRFL